MKKSRTERFPYGKEFFIKRTILRIMAIIMLLVIIFPVAIKTYTFLGGSIIVKDYNNGSFVAKKLESELAVPGCFYDGAKESYVFPGFEFGHGLEETVEQLGIRDWYTEKKLEDGINELEQAKDVWEIVLADYVNVNAFGAVYALNYDFTRDLGCNSVVLYTNILLKEYKPSGILTYDNVMSYDEAWDYFNKLYDRFILEYGEPDEKVSYTADEVNEESGIYEPEKAIKVGWISGSGKGQTDLALQGYTYSLTSARDETYFVFRIRIAVSQDLDGLSFDEWLAQDPV